MIVQCLGIIEQLHRVSLARHADPSVTSGCRHRLWPARDRDPAPTLLGRHVAGDEDTRRHQRRRSIVQQAERDGLRSQACQEGLKLRQSMIRFDNDGVEAPQGKRRASALLIDFDQRDAGRRDERGRVKLPGAGKVIDELDHARSHWREVAAETTRQDGRSAGRPTGFSFSLQAAIAAASTVGCAVMASALAGGQCGRSISNCL